MWHSMYAQLMFVDTTVAGKLQCSESYAHIGRYVRLRVSFLVLDSIVAISFSQAR